MAPKEPLQLEAITFINIKNKEVWTEPFTGIDLILIPGGNFKIGDHFSEGDQDEKKTRSIGIETFFLGQTEVTQNEWSKLMETNPSRFKGSNNPVEKKIYQSNIKLKHLPK